MRFYELNEAGALVRVRLTPHSSCREAVGIWQNARGEAFLQVKVRAAPEKGRANAELIVWLADQLEVAKSHVQLVSGESERCKKLSVSGEAADLSVRLEKLTEEIS